MNFIHVCRSSRFMVMGIAALLSLCACTASKPPSSSDSTGPSSSPPMFTPPPPPPSFPAEASGSGAPEAAAPSAPAPTPAPAVETRPAAAAPSAPAFPGIPVRDFCIKDQACPSGYGAYGYLIFTRRPPAMPLKRFTAICEAYTGNLEPASSYGTTPKSTLMPTFWFLTASPGQETCNEFIQLYDFSRAKTLASSLKKLHVTGPILVAWTQPYPHGLNAGKTLILDLSRFSDEDLNRAFGIWMDRIARDPKYWQQGFNIVLLREEFRSFIQAYGSQILQVVNLKRA